MLIFPDHFDAADRAFIGSYEGGENLPQGALIDGYITVIAFTDPDTGQQRWFGHPRMSGQSVSHSVGLLEMMKWQLIKGNDQGYYDE